MHQNVLGILNKKQIPRIENSNLICRCAWPGKVEGTGNSKWHKNVLKTLIESSLPFASFFARSFPRLIIILFVNIDLIYMCFCNSGALLWLKCMYNCTNLALLLLLLFVFLFLISLLMNRTMWKAPLQFCIAYVRARISTHCMWISFNWIYNQIND